MSAERYWEERWRTEKAENEKLQAELREILGLLGREQRGSGGPLRLKAMEIVRTALERVGR
jgi:hypothetical protein